MTQRPGTTRTRPPAHGLSRGRHVQLIVVLGSLIALGPLTIDMYLPAFPQLADELDASAASVQLTLTGMLGGLAFGQLVIGPLSDAFGRRRPLLAGLVVHALASLLCAVAPNIAVLSVVRVLQGFAGAAISVVALATVRDLFSGVAVARTMSRLMLVIGLAPIVAPSIGGFILQVTDWRGIFFVLAGAAVVLIGVALVGLRETLPVERRRSARVGATLRTYRSLLSDRTFVALVLVAGLSFSSLFVYVSGASFVLQEGFGLDARTFGLVFGANSAALTIASQLNPTLIRRFGPANVLTGAILVSMAAAVALLVAGLAGGGLVTVLVPLMVVLASAGLAMPNTPALALNRHGEAAGTASAMLGCVQFGVGALVAPLVGVLGSTTAAPMGAVMLTVTGLAALLMFAVVRRDPTVQAVR
ncbi:Bcr/CflA family multidrug efflux MFS transporter [Nocardioides iriomotensis]|uniref:Bcr/CflA family multidrug efflux MFS transporter n=1 Tax=Nocardioides iriomotensis TaxID=715784 RepID=UPI001F0D5161|nr:Bcr/CflA family multidrug efflux MFS transporter [Nocardioides iriomotensis]